MASFKCKMCGGSIEVDQNTTVGVCDSCGTKQTLPRLDDDKKANLYDRANHFRRNNDYDKAIAIFEQILNEDNTDAEAYWSLVLCRYGIEYVEDPTSNKRIATVNRSQFTSIYMDEDYKSALKYADGYQRHVYEEEAKVIDNIQKGILEVSSREEPFDVFICYKETDSSGRRTLDSVLANDLYHQLMEEGFKVFFSRITLEDILGTAYEPYIFAALNSSKVMVVIGTKLEYYKAVWVKNEWSRYLSLIKKGAKKVLIPAYKDMDPYDLPEEFSHLQAQDMSKLGFMQDLVRGIKKILSADTTEKTNTKETVAVGSVSINVDTLITRVFMFLEDGDWQSANEYSEKVLDIDPKNAQAYLGKLMAENMVKKQVDLKNCTKPFDHSNNYLKAVRFGDETLREELRGYITHINLMSIYTNAIQLMRTAKRRYDYNEAASLFQMIPGFKDADTLAEQCLENAEAIRMKKESLEKEIESLKEKLVEIIFFTCKKLTTSNLLSKPKWKTVRDSEIEELEEKVGRYSIKQLAKENFLAKEDFAYEEVQYMVRNVLDVDDLLEWKKQSLRKQIEELVKEYDEEKSFWNQIKISDKKLITEKKLQSLENQEYIVKKLIGEEAYKTVSRYINLREESIKLY